LEKPRRFINEELEPYATDYREILGRFESHALSEDINRILPFLSRLDNFYWQPPAIEYIARHRDSPQEILRFLTDLERLAYSLFLARETPTNRITRYGKVLESLEAARNLFADDSPLQLSEDEKRIAREVLNSDIYPITRIVQPLLLRLDDAIGAGDETYNYSIITVEHVLPQNPKSDSQWLLDFPNEEVLMSWVHKLANLVLLSRRKNPQAGNMDFDVKKTRYFSSVGGVTNFAITNSVINEPHWNQATLARRQAELVTRLVTVWRLTAKPPPT
jgi:hypothetical protein